MSKPPLLAVILAAGTGSRLQPTYDEGPKGLLKVEGESLVARSVQLLLAQGIQRVLLVVGHKRAAYAAFAQQHTAVDLVENPDYARTGTLRSLNCALGEVKAGWLLLESDLFYEPRALSCLLADPREDLVLASGFTGAGDEVWVESEGDRLRGLSKDRARLRSVDGEFVGICKLSARTGRLLADACVAEANQRSSYETDGLVTVARRHVIDVLTVPDLRWGEVDDAAHLERVRNLVAPSLREPPGAASTAEREGG